jgi:hypothetical protein
MKRTSEKAARVLTVEELRSVMGGIRKPAVSVGGGGSGSGGSANDIQAEPWERKK